MTDYIVRLFNNLDAWRHLPSYQLERRADAFFSVYLPEILEIRSGARPSHIIPEFPVHIPTIYPRAQGNRSFKIDYLAWFSDDRAAQLVELKTDPTSHRVEQDLYLLQSQEAGLPKLLAGIAKIYAATSSKHKYDRLLDMLHDAGLVNVRGKGLFDIAVGAVPLEIVYLQPHPGSGSASVITFTEIADVIESKPDALSRRFAASLRNWANVPAGVGIDTA